MAELDDFRDKVIDVGDRLGNDMYNKAISIRNKLVKDGVNSNLAGSTILQAHMYALSSITAAVISEIKEETQDDHDEFNRRHNAAMEAVTKCVQDLLSSYVEAGKSIVLRFEMPPEKKEE